MSGSEEARSALGGRVSLCPNQATLAQGKGPNQMVRASPTRSLLFRVSVACRAYDARCFVKVDQIEENLVQAGLTSEASTVACPWIAVALLPVNLSELGDQGCHCRPEVFVGLGLIQCRAEDVRSETAHGCHACQILQTVVDLLFDGLSVLTLDEPCAVLPSRCASPSDQFPVLLG